jgi:hypothetical protein
MSKTDCMHIASSLSGIIEVAVTHPLDRIKTQMQIMTLNNTKSNAQHHNTNILSGIKLIYQNDKIKGFYSGIVPRFIGIVPMRLMYWSSMTISSDYVSSSHNKKQFELWDNKYISTNTSNFIINLIPGLVTGLAQSIIDNPIEVVKIKIMSGNSNIAISNLYQGFGYLLVRNILFAIPVAYSIKTYGKENPFFAGAVGGLIGSIVSHPFDVIKTERQRLPTTTTTTTTAITTAITTTTTINLEKTSKKITLRHMILKNPSGLFSGLAMRCSLSFINMGIGFVVFNHIYKGLYKFVNDKHLD